MIEDTQEKPSPSSLLSVSPHVFLPPPVFLSPSLPLQASLHVENPPPFSNIISLTLTSLGPSIYHQHPPHQGPCSLHSSNFDSWALSRVSPSSLWWTAVLSISHHNIKAVLWPCCLTCRWCSLALSPGHILALTSFLKTLASSPLFYFFLQIPTHIQALVLRISLFHVCFLRELGPTIRTSVATLGLALSPSQILVCILVSSSLLGITVWIALWRCKSLVSKSELTTFPPNSFLLYESYFYSHNQIWDLPTSCASSTRLITE